MLANTLKELRGPVPRASNRHVKDGIGEEEFVARRRARDATLEMPTLILPAIRVNVRAGQMPPLEANGIALPAHCAQCPAGTALSRPAVTI